MKNSDKEHLLKIESKVLVRGNIMDPIKQWILDKHKDQKYGDQPYSVHLRKVEEIACCYKHELHKLIDVTTKEIIYAALGHDLKEDQNVTDEELKAQGIPCIVIEAIESVTDEPGKNRRERKLLTLPKTAKNILGKYIKICDRAANCLEGGKLDMYKKEHEEFKSYLYVEGEFPDLWEGLDELIYEN
jgi:(p)ppGpp synthase/HD superfamily hydrolase